MHRLLEIGFEAVGHWLIEEEQPVFELVSRSTQKNVLYAFVSDAEVMYVGKTVQTLRNRLAGYKTPGNDQTTNINNRRLIKESLERGKTIDILALPDNGLMRYGEFHLNFAAGLEDDIIRKLKPPWNSGKREEVPNEVEMEKSVAEPMPTFEENFHFTLQPAYFQAGFFNVGVEFKNLIGTDGQKIELFLGEAREPILGVINRRANKFGTPRVMGGTALRDWFQAHAQEKDRIVVQVNSPISIRLHVGVE